MNLAELAKRSKASQDIWEMYHLLRHVWVIKPKVVVEIGVDGGGSMATWHDAFHPELLIGIELKPRAEIAGYRIIKGNSQDERTSTELVRLLGERKIDFLFIDGDHHYEAVRADFQLYAPLVRKGGIIAFHDIRNRGIQGVNVNIFMDELDERTSYKTADYVASNKSPGTRLIWV